MMSLQLLNCFLFRIRGLIRFILFLRLFTLALIFIIVVHRYDLNISEKVVIGTGNFIINWVCSDISHYIEIER